MKYRTQQELFVVWTFIITEMLNNTF